MAISSTKRAWIVVAILACAAATAFGLYLYRAHRPLAGSSVGTAPEILSQLPAEAPALVFINVASLRSSPLVLKIAALADPQQDPEYKRFVQQTGFDYARDLERVGLAVWPGQSPHIPLDRVIALADGRFDRQKIDSYIAGDPQIHRGPGQVAVLTPVPGFRQREFGFVSAQRVAFAAGAGIAGSVQPENSAHINGAMQPLITRVAGAPLFGVARADNLPESFYASFKKSPQLEHVVRSIRGLAFAGQPDGNGLHLVLDIESESMKDAVSLAAQMEIFRMIGAVALSDAKARRQLPPQEAALLKALLTQVKVTQQDVWIRLTLDLTPEMLGTTPARGASAD